MRFSVVAVPLGGGRRWVDSVRAWDEQGWDAVLVPDTMGTASTFPALAAAAAVTTRLHLRTWVLAAPLRTPVATVREVKALQLLSDGRFELGIGTGRPDAAREAAMLGVDWPTAPGRIAQLERVVAAVRNEVSPTPPVVVTASGPKMIQAAARMLTDSDSGDADRLGLALAPSADAAELEELTGRIRAAVPRVRMAFQLVGVGDRLSGWIARQGAWTATGLAARGAVAMLPNSVEAAADALGEWPQRYGIDEVIVPAEFTEAALPVLRRLRA